MCQECKQHPCHPRCPNRIFVKIGNCDKCGNGLYEEYVNWTDDNGNRFCSEECAKDYYGIKEMDC